MFRTCKYRDDVSWQSYRAVPSLSSVEKRNLEKTKFPKSSLRYVIFASNIIIMITGTASLAIGAWLRTDSRFRDFLSQRYRNVVEEAFWQAPTLYIFSYVLIVVGLFMLVVGMVGFCGASSDSRVLLLIYAVALCILILCTISAKIYIIFRKYGIDVEVSDALSYMVQHYYQGAGIVQESLDRLQQAFRCCGNTGCSDFRFLYQDIPRSCDIRCDGCHYRIMIALRIGFSVSFVIFAITLIAELVAVGSALILGMRSRSVTEGWLDKMRHRGFHNGKNYYWHEPDQYVDLNSLQSDDCPVPDRHHLEKLASHQKY